MGVCRNGKGDFSYITGENSKVNYGPSIRTTEQVVKRPCLTDTRNVVNPAQKSIRRGSPAQKNF